MASIEKANRLEEEEDAWDEQEAAEHNKTLRTLAERAAKKNYTAAQEAARAADGIAQIASIETAYQLQIAKQTTRNYAAAQEAAQMAHEAALMAYKMLRTIAARAQIASIEADNQLQIAEQAAKNYAAAHDRAEQATKNYTAAQEAARVAAEAARIASIGADNQLQVAEQFAKKYADAHDRAEQATKDYTAAMAKEAAFMNEPDEERAPAMEWEVVAMRKEGQEANKKDIKIDPNIIIL
jgi:hypothetical protein